MSGSGSPQDAVQKIRIMDNCSLDASFKSPFYCGWEWHTRRIGGACSEIYALASRLVSQTNEKVFWSSASSVASHLGCHQSTVLIGMRALCEFGFFEKLGVNEESGTNLYRVLSHEEWQERHPGQCVVRNVRENSETTYLRQKSSK